MICLMDSRLLRRFQRLSYISCKTGLMLSRYWRSERAFRCLNGRRTSKDRFSQFICIGYCLRSVKKKCRTITMSLMWQAHAGMEILAVKLFHQGTNTGYYLGSLVYVDLAHRQYTSESYEDHTMEEMNKTFQKWENGAHKKGLDQASMQHDDGPSPVPFFAIGHTNDGCFVPDVMIQRLARCDKVNRAMWRSVKRVFGMTT